VLLPVKLLLIFVLCIAMFSVWGIIATAVVQQPGSRIIFPVTLQWRRQAGVNSYRLQIASDEKFHDIIFDGRVRADRYVVDQIEPGAYFWRIAPELNGPLTFSTPEKFFLSGGVLTPVSVTPHNPRSHSDAPGSRVKKKGRQ
jgi:hypothetical protein